MKRPCLLLLLAAVQLLAFAQYRNPVIPGYHPDPSVCRVGDDYYLVNSSFQYFPGVPIFHSRDLVNWEQIGNVLDRESQLPLKGASSWLGIYAPTIRYHDGTYYMITTNVGNGGNFLVTATNPCGPWSEPVWLQQQGIDPSLYFEGGKCYMVSNPDNTIMLCQIDPATGRQLTASKPIWRGTGGRYPEGPHLYKKDGYYYLLISEGGTEIAHKLTIARSRRIDGPYEANPANPILTHCSMAGQSNPIQGTGHGDLVQAADGSWWMVFLGFRFMNGSYHHLGRETFLAPVEWNEGEWPVVNGGQPVDTLMNTSLAPSHPRTPVSPADWNSPEWVYIQNPDSSKYQVRDGHLRLGVGNSSLLENQQPTFLGRRQESAVFTLDTRLSMADSQSGDLAGLTVYQIHDGHCDLYMQNVRGQMHVRLNYILKSLDVKSGDVALGSATAVWLRIVSDGVMYRFYYSLDGSKYEYLNQVDCSLLSTEVVGGFTGVVLGMFAQRAGAQFHQGPTWATFEYFDYQENSPINH